MKNRWIWIPLGGFVIVIGAFLFLNFRVAVSDTQSEESIITTGIGVGLPYAMQRREKISITLVGEGPLDSALRKSLMVELSNAGIGDIELVQTLAPTYQNPLLVIKVGKPSVLWTPLFATSQVSIQAGYSSTGDINTTFMGESSTAIDDKHGPALTMYAEYKVNDRSWGLISRLGYYHVLADSVAQDIVVAVKKLYEAI